MPFGSIFRTFQYILLTGDTIHLSFKNKFLTRLGFKVLGIPHIGLRLRARKIKKNLPLHATHMLDAGFGTGVYSFVLANTVKKIDAIDIDMEKIDYVKQVNPFNNISFQIMDLTNLTFDDSYFDLIICSDVLEIIKKDEVAFAELARVLNRGGTLLMTVPYDSSKNKACYKEYGHVRPGYTKRDVQDLCIKNNLTIVKSEVYSYNVAEKALAINYIFINEKILFGLLFYPLYITALIGEFLHLGSPNGIFFKIMKK
jgi:SAM-dependent methyltransferase